MLTHSQWRKGVSLEACRLSADHLQAEMIKSQVSFTDLCHTDLSSTCGHEENRATSYEPWKRNVHLMGGGTHYQGLRWLDDGLDKPLPYVHPELLGYVCPQSHVWRTRPRNDWAHTASAEWPEPFLFPCFSRSSFPVSLSVFHLTVPGKWNCSDGLSVFVLQCIKRVETFDLVIGDENVNLYYSVIHILASPSWGLTVWQGMW